MDTFRSNFFVNRVKELEFLTRDIHKKRELSRFLLVCATTGIGKSSLIDKAFSQSESPSVRVSINIEQANGKIEGNYFKELVKKMSLYAESTESMNSLEVYMKNHDFYKGVAEAITKTITEYLNIDTFLESYKNAKEYKKINNWFAGDEELLDICLGYLIFIFKNNRVLVTFDNFQKIDKTSLSLLITLLESTKKGYFVGEFTINNSQNESAEISTNLGQRSIDFNRLQVYKIDKQELIDAILNEQDLVVSILNNSYDQSGGNLHNLALLKQAYHAQDFDISFDNFDSVTVNLLNSLGPKSALVFSQIEIHAGSVDRSTLTRCFIETDNTILANINEYWLIVDELVSVGLLKANKDSVSIGHDSISMEFKQTAQVRKIYPIVARNWVRYYQKIEREPIASEQSYIYILLWQIHFLLKIQSYSEIRLVLSKLSKCVSEAPANSIVGYLDLIAESFLNDSGKILRDQKIIRWLTIMYYKFGYMDRILNIVQAEDLDEPIIFLCHSSAASTIQSEQPAVLERIRSIKGYTNKSYQLALTLVEIRVLRSSYQLQEAEELWRKHYDRNTFFNTKLEEGFLQYVSLVVHDDFDLRNKCLKKSLDLFRKSNNSYGIITTLNTLARDAVYMGNNELSLNYLLKAREESSKTAYPRHQLYNNLSVLEIFNQEINETTVERLKNALRICTNEYDQLIISSNLLCISIIQKDDSFGFRLYQNLKQKVIQKFDSRNLITQISLFNCYKYALLIGDNTEAENIQKNYLKHMVFYRHKEVWDYLLGKSRDHSSNYEPPKNYYPNFIVDWEIDFYSALNNSQ